MSQAEKTFGQPAPGGANREILRLQVLRSAGVRKKKRSCSTTTKGEEKSNQFLRLPTGRSSKCRRKLKPVLVQVHLDGKKWSKRAVGKRKE